MWNKAQQALIIINGIFLLGFVAALGFYYRLVPEDYYAVIGNETYGPWQQAFVVCNTWGGRFFSYLFSFILLDWHQNGFSYLWYMLAGCLIIFFSFYSIISNLTSIAKVDLSRTQNISAASLLFIAIFYFTPGKTESWFWIAASPSYFWGLVMAFAGLAFLLFQPKKWYHIIFSSLCFLYPCSASEPFALLIILFFLLTFLYNFLHQKPLKNSLLLIPPLFMGLLGFGIMYFASGTSYRLEAMPELSFNTKLFRGIYAMIKYYYTWFPILLLIMVMLLPVLIPPGIYIKFFNEKFSYISPVHFLFISIITYSAILFFSFLPSCMVMGEAGPLRSWHHIAVYNLVIYFISGLYFIQHYAKRITLKKSQITAIFLFLTCIHLSYLYIEIKKAYVYANAVDKRISYLKALQNGGYKKIIQLEALPPAGLLFSAEINSDKNYYTNKFLKQGLNLEFEVALRKP